MLRKLGSNERSTTSLYSTSGPYLGPPPDCICSQAMNGGCWYYYLCSLPVGDLLDQMAAVRAQKAALKVQMAGPKAQMADAKAQVVVKAGTVGLKGRREA